MSNGTRYRGAGSSSATSKPPRDEAGYQAYFADKMAGYRAGGLSGNYAPATPDFAYEDVNAAVGLVREMPDKLPPLFAAMCAPLRLPFGCRGLHGRVARA
ncbi:MAG: hypothetical protein IJP86_01725 [Synergistaceae bacterium]|nr:hypothetical protein [Synergistaceae bacterium]